MEATASVAAARGVSLPMPSSQPSRKEWRMVSEQSVRNSSSEDLERSKVGQSDERTIYEVQQGRESADVDFCLITIDGGSENDVLQNRLHSVAKQREELQHMEIEIRAQIIASWEIIQMQNSLDAQIKEYSNVNVKLQEQLHGMKQTIHELERKMEEKDRELHAIKLDTKAAWAKEDLLREQSKELQTFRRERDNSEVEKAQHVKQIHDFQEHIQEKERHFLELQEQHRVAQETILYKDEQLRDAQAWITRIQQEMDVLQSTTTHYSLQAELRERTEQYHQLWVGCQGQFTEMERLHAHAIHQLKLELSDARGRSGTYHEETQMPQKNYSSQFGHNNGKQLDVNGSIMPSANTGGLPTGNAENASSFVSTGNPLTEANHGVAISPSSLFGMPTYLPPAQMTALHPFVMHQGVHQSVPSHVAQSHVDLFHSVPTISPLQHWQNHQASPDGSQVPTHNQYPPSQTDQNLLRSGTNYDFEVSSNVQAIRSEYLDTHPCQGMEPDTVITPTAVEQQVDKSYLVAPQLQQGLQNISSQLHDALRLDFLSQNSETKEETITTFSTNHVREGQGFTTEQESSANTPSSGTSINHVNFSEPTLNNSPGVISSEALVSSGQKNVPTIGKVSEIALLDERSLLACIVRTIPPGSSGRIRISSTLPNRLGKMLAPFHWYDYKKKYGKLDDFVAGHPELFLIQGDFIQLREGAQEIIAITAAVAKIAAAAKTASSPYSSLLPSVAVTPVAQSHRLKMVPSTNSNSVTSAADYTMQLSIPNQHSNGVSLNAGGISNVRILSKPKDPLELNDNENRPVHSSELMAVVNGANHGRSDLDSSVSKGSTHWKPGAALVGKQQGRIQFGDHL